MASYILINIPQIIETAGYAGLFIAVFLESGVFFGFFLPGDSLLFSAGFLASQGSSNIWFLILTVTIAAILGDSAGYWFGAKVGPKLFTRDDSFFFRKKHIARTHAFFEKWGARAVILARFVPVVRTFTPILAGVGQMSYRKFISYNVIGGVLWGAGVTFIGYFLGSKFPESVHYLPAITIVIILVSVLPIAREWWLYAVRSKKQNLEQSEQEL